MFRGLRVALVFPSIVWFLCAPSMWAQFQPGEIRGTVTDPSGAVIRGAQVELGSVEVEVRSVTTNNEGSYSIRSLAPGVYRITVRAKGFEVFEQEEVQVSGEPQILDVQLKIATAGQTIAVSGKDEQEGVTGTVLSGKRIESLPDDPDQLRTMLDSLASQSSGVGSTQIYVNGFPSDTPPQKSSIAEIRINQDIYSAEYAGAGSGRIEIRTKPGSGRFHGGFRMGGNSSSLDARNPLVEAQPSYYTLEPGGQVSGPINKWASYFLAGGYVRSQRDVVTSAVILDPQFVPVNLSEAIPAPSSAGHLDSRLDLQIGTKVSLNILYDFFRQSTPKDGIGGLALASEAIKSTSEGHTVQANSMQVISGKMLNEIGFQISRSSDQHRAMNSAPTITVEGAFQDGGNSAGNASNRDDHYRFHDNFSWSVGKHVVKFGGETNRESLSSRSTAGFNGEFIFPSLAAYQITEEGLAGGLTPQEIRAAGGGASQFSITSGAEATSASVSQFALYAEDTWCPLSNLAITPGIRLERELGPYGRVDIAPRMGLRYGVDGRKKKPARTTVMGGYGWAYAPFPLGSIFQLKALNGVHQQRYVVGAPDFYPMVPPIGMLATEPAGVSALYRVSQDLRDPLSMQGTLGIVRELNSKASLFLTYGNARKIHQIVVRNANAPLPGTYDPSDPTSGIRPFGSSTNIYEYGSDGITNQNFLRAGLHIHSGKKVNLFASYTLLNSNSDTSGSPSNPYDLKADYGRTTSSKNRFSAVGQVSLPFRVDVSSTLTFNSSVPFNIVVGQDLNGDGQFIDRPSFATDLTRPSVVFTKWGAFDTEPIAGQRIIPVNYGTGPPEYTADLYVSKSFVFGQKPGQAGTARNAEAASAQQAQPLPGEQRFYTLKIAMSVQNVFNIVNPGSPIGTLGSPLFGKSNSVAPGRSFYLHAAFSF